LFASLWLVSPVYADDDGLDVTMGVVTSPAASPDAATKIIKLPDNASETGKANSEFGLATANAAKSSHGREFGQAKADAAKQNGVLKRRGPR